MHWCIQENIYNESGLTELKNLLTRLNVQWSEHKLVPFVYDLEPTLNITHNNIICFGSYAMLNVAKKNNFFPGVFDISNISYDILINMWGENMLNYDSKQILFKDLFTIKYQDFFMRPSTDTKEISGKVYNINDLDLITLWKNTMETKKQNLYVGGLHPETSVIVSSTKNILQEYRFFIVDGKVITGSMYKLGNKANYTYSIDNHIIDYAQTMVDIYQPNEAFVIDIAVVMNADTKNIEYKIVEINTFNAAGFYNSDISKIVFALLEKYS